MAIPGGHHFVVRRLPNRIKEVRFPNVDGHSTMDLGEELYEITQSGEVDIATDPTALRRVMWADKPGVMAGTSLIDVDTLGQGTYSYCRLVDIETERISPACIRYRYVWRQVQAGSNMTYPF